ncbi:MAG: hypothetical protein C0497_07380 [Gemmatimonas sp.]|nr:hypothetical protein [Gemmatimonas sp.]
MDDPTCGSSRPPRAPAAPDCCPSPWTTSPRRVRVSRQPVSRTPCAKAASGYRRTSTTPPPSSTSRWRRWCRGKAGPVTSRAALLSVLPLVKRGQAPFSAFEVLAVPMLGEREFFIRKAIGWGLREISKTDPGVVAAFLRAHRADVSGLTLREGAKYLPARDRRALLPVRNHAPQ